MFRLKQFIKLSFLVICLSAGILIILNIPVRSQQGVNYVVRTIEMPLYIKIIEFLDRDYHYKEIVKQICQGYTNDEEKVLALFEWTHQNIKRDIPEAWPIIDDHVWHIIVRGYGANDQLSDVFTTLCNYAGVDAFFTWVYKPGRTKRIPLSFVNIEERWSIFDPYHSTYFKNEDGEFADIEEIESAASWSAVSLNGKPAIDYAPYFGNLPPVKDIGLSRANIQSPLNRLLFELKKLKKALPNGYF